MVDTGRNLLFLAVALLACGASGAHAQDRWNPYTADAPAAKAFCASPEFKALQCGWATEKERKLTGSKQCDGWPLSFGDKVRCESGVQRIADKLPAKIGQHTGTRHFQALSLACKGRIVVRAVFKLLTPAPAGNKVAVRLRNDPEGTTVMNDKGTMVPGYTEPSDVVRCKLQLLAGAEPEEARALKAKEVDCVKCSRDACPAAEGTWYRWVFLAVVSWLVHARMFAATFVPAGPRQTHASPHTPSALLAPRTRSDAYTSNAAGCGDANFARGKYYMRFEELNFGGGDDPVLILLAKFEVCDNAGCFDAKYEADKAKGAAAAPKQGRRMSSAIYPPRLAHGFILQKDG
jgi:hypothetical protein